MIFSIPIYIEERSQGLNRPSIFVTKPLFHDGPIQHAEKLGRALNKLTGQLHELLHEAGRDPRHDRLAEWTFHPTLEDTTLNLRLELESGSKLKRFFLVGYPALGRKLFFSATLPEFQFEVLRGQNLLERANAAFSRYFRDQEKENGADNVDEFALQGKARLTTLEIELKPALLAKKPPSERRALLFGDSGKKDGERELRTTGRSMRSLYPDDLERAIGRDSVVEELGRLLASSDRRPILLMGPRKVGKTTILHELVWQMCSRKQEKWGGNREIWQLSPMRLISGMSYLGEWENRVLAILDYAWEKDRVIYFDDLLGLFTAGIHSASDLNVAQVLRPALEKRRVRVIAEITPEAWRVLRERDRAFADLFHILPIHEPPEAETLRILVHVVRQLENQYHAEFGFGVVPVVYDLHQRFASDASFPGKAAGFLRRLAVRYAGSQITGHSVRLEFHMQSGLQLEFLEDHELLTRNEIIQRMGLELFGQERALQAFADIVVAFKMRLNDPRRPLGTLLLLGPTGVGKTQSAKALANFLFGTPERMLRFDMNELVDSASVGRLIGTFDEPEGLLTGAIRRQPFSVVLFDEIEKAAPEVFDVLLAVLDEGRLTDALGRVASFTNAVILLTSNLGVRESRSRLGFVAGQGNAEAEDSVFVSAAERFFRPEFFNRIDRIIPFRTLNVRQLEGIAGQLINSVFSRDGLRRRECILKISPESMGRLVELGQSPGLGARALKRVIERELAQPLAERLAMLSPGTPILARFTCPKSTFHLHLQALEPAARSVSWPETFGISDKAGKDATRLGRLVETAYDALDRFEAEMETHAPTGRIELGNLPPQAARYYAGREQLKKADRLAQATERSRRPVKKSAASAALPKAKPNKLVVRQMISGNPRLGRLRDNVDLQLELAEWGAGETVEIVDSPALALCRELALLEAMLKPPWDDRSLALVCQPLEEIDDTLAFDLAQYFHDFFNSIWGFSAAFLFAQPTLEKSTVRRVLPRPNSQSTQGLFLTGFNLCNLMPAGPYTVLVRRTNGTMGALLVQWRTVSTPAEAEAFARNPATTFAEVASDEVESLGPVLQMLTEGKTFVDFRTGLVVPARPTEEEFRALMLSALPLPGEITI